MPLAKNLPSLKLDITSICLLAATFLSFHPLRYLWQPYAPQKIESG